MRCDRQVGAGQLRELQEAGDPDIVAEVGGLFIQHSPENGRSYNEIR